MILRLLPVIRMCSYNMYRQGAMLAPIRLTNAGSCPSRQRDCVATAARSAETKGTALFLPVLPTPLRGYCCAVRQNERQLPCGSGETQGEASPAALGLPCRASLPPCPYATVMLYRQRQRRQGRHLLWV